MGAARPPDCNLPVLGPTVGARAIDCRCMRRGPLVTIMLVAVAAVLAISFGILQRGRGWMMLDFQAGQSKLAQNATADLPGYLDSFDRDTRLASALAQRTRSSFV